ncbi:TP53-regulating kinase [Cimex lectularius]|uniref:non-specific serine/threonine protein kinase n=1 Tax=Cimex lectularius TaxID=79782 RepID=A0A8I6TC64_CIMLE|nr:TP53-regulating kinase [Cimex lectularius]
MANLDGFDLWKQGAEAKMYTGAFLGDEVVVKERFLKKYRHPDLDEALSKERLRNEARGILRCKAAGVKCPTVYYIDLDRRLIYLQKLSGASVKEALDDGTDKALRIAELIGESVGKIHSNNLIHGDLTTSNMILQDDEIYLIDFGLSTVAQSAEDKAVDLYVLERALSSTHELNEQFFMTIIKFYRKANKGSKEVMRKYEEVKARGRKRTMVG